MTDEQYWEFNAQIGALRITVLALTRLAPDQSQFRREFEDYALMQMAMLNALPTSEAAIAAFELRIEQMRQLIWAPAPT